jgi:hypothetical protein
MDTVKNVNKMDLDMKNSAFFSAIDENDESELNRLSPVLVQREVIQPLSPIRPVL